MMFFIAAQCVLSLLGNGQKYRFNCNQSQDKKILLAILFLQEINNSIITNRLLLIVCKFITLVYINQKKYFYFFCIDYNFKINVLKKNKMQSKITDLNMLKLLLVKGLVYCN